MLTFTPITPQVFLKRLMVELTPVGRRDTPTTPPEKRAKRVATETRLRATATASMYKHASSHFSWGFGESAAVMALCKGAGRFIADMIGACIPGAPKLNGIRAKGKRWVKEWEDSFRCRTKTMVTVVFDNIGVYLAGTSLASGDALSKCVVTNAGVVHTTGTNMLNLQCNASLSPANWVTTWSDVPAGFFNTRTCVMEGEDMSEQQILEADRDAYILKAFEKLEAVRDPVTGEWSDEIVRWVCRREPTGFFHHPTLRLN